MGNCDPTYVTLVENKPGTLDGDTTIRATLKSDGSVELVDSRMGSDQRLIYANGAAFKAKKFSPNQPDLRGHLQQPFDPDRESDPGCRRVTAWWRWTVRGKRALRLCLSPPSKPSPSSSSATEPLSNNQ